MGLDVFLAFLGACALLFVKPGPAMSVIVANSVEYRVRGGLITVAGNVFGLAVVIAIVGLGLAWIAEVMRDWFEWISLAGSAYLVWLGVNRLRQAGKLADYGENPTGELFRDGLIVAVANPEVLIFLAAFLPPFVDPSRPVAPQLVILGLAFVTVGTIGGVLLAVLAGQTRHFLSGDRLRWLDYLSGGLLILAGLWLAWPNGMP